MDNDTVYPVIVSIDFGTTYSGCSFTLIGNEQIHDIIKWPKSNAFYAKVPTLLYYRDKNNKLLDWGRGARLLSLRPDQHGTLYQYFKLALASDIPLPPNKSAVDVISDYLRLFHEYVCEQLAQVQLLQDYTQAQYRYCITVPAIWSDESKSRMRESAIQAGIIYRDDPLYRLELISEPEAAAAYCENKYHSWNLTDGDVFMIVDAGGGTVDLITYLIEDATPPRVLREVTRGHGGMCGSAFIDQNMRALIESKMSDSAMPSCMFEMIMDTFVERIKPDFRGDELEYRIPVPAGALQFIHSHYLDNDNHMMFGLDELNLKVFSPVLERVVSLVNEQLRQADSYVSAIFLVGGFGCSEYLYDILKAKIDPDQVGEIAMPPRGELAVAHGAVYHVLKPDMVKSKLLRRTYGVRSRLPFEEGLDPESSAIVTKDGIKRCSTRFDVIAHKGQRMTIDEKIKRSYWIEYPKHTEADLYVTDQDDIPRHMTDHAVTKLAEIPIKMPLLPDVLPGTRIDVTIEFVLRSTEIKIIVCLAGTISEHVLSDSWS